jgi:hypothetical protein
MFFLGSQSTLSLGKFTREEGDLLSDMDMGGDPKAMELDPTLLGGALGEMAHIPMLTLALTP